MATANAWITRKAKNDFGFIFLPGLLGIILTYFLHEGSFIFLVFSFFVLSLVDSGHVYITFWRTWCNPDEMKRNPTYWLAPIIIVLFFGTWIYLKIPHLWDFVIYATAYHHIRQYYGFMKWYETKNKTPRCFSGWFFYMLAYTPIFIYHFRSGVQLDYYTNNDLLSSPNPELYSAGVMVYALVIISWLIYEVGLFAKGYRELNRFLSVLVPAILYGVCFFFGTNAVEILFPLVLGHGIPYYLVIIRSLKHQTNTKKFNYGMLTLIIIVSGLVFGAFETFMEEGFLYDLEVYSYMLKNSSLVQALVVGIYMVPLFSHFVFDAIIWRKWHPEAKMVYGD